MSKTEVRPLTIEPPEPPELEEGYYVDNFEVVLETVHRRYGDLLSAGELAFVDDWRTLTLSARRLFVRLTSRKGPCFRRDRIEYAEIAELDDAFNELECAGFLDRAVGVEPAELLGLLLKAEGLDLARGLLPEAAPVPAAASRKGEVVEALVREVEAEVLDRAIRDLIEVVRPLRQDDVLVFRLLFFGNLSQDWTEFVLRDLGVLRFEAYELRTDLRLFPSRQAIEDTLALRTCRSDVHALVREGELEEALDLGRAVLERHHLWHPVARRYFDHVCNELGRSLERAAVACDTTGWFEAALDYYGAATAPPARERRARVLARLERFDEALALCIEIETDPRDETEVAFAPRFAKEIRRRRGEAVARPRRSRRPIIGMEIARIDGVPVETLALEALDRSGRRGFFSENWLWKSLFGLAFWDVVFAPVEGAFQHPFQYGPLDLSSSEFRKARRELVVARLDELRTCRDLGPRLLAIYDEKLDTANRLVAWGDALRERLEIALEVLTGEHLALVCDRLSRDVRRYRRGFPDLFVLREEAPGFELMEVKAPGDQLRPEQGAWIDYLNANGLPASILKLTWEKPPRTSQLSPTST